MSKKRKSNIELFRIVLMLLIIIHHYVGNSTLANIIYDITTPCSVQWIWAYIIGAWGKMAINCFILITGYFMCKQKINVCKYFQLLGEILFYKIVIYSIFVLSGYEAFSIKEMVRNLIPIMDYNDTNFVTCYLLFYLFIPYLNLILNKIDEKELRNLLLICLLVFSVIPSIPFVSLHVNYISWFMIVYLIGAYIRMYPKEIYLKSELWGGYAIGFAFVFCVLSLVGFRIVNVWLYQVMGYYPLGAYHALVDSNSIGAVVVSICMFIYFSQLPIKENRYINIVAKSTFGVLLIHAHSDTMREWLWDRVLQNASTYNTPYIYIHSILSTIGVFCVCTVIDLVRRRCAQGIMSMCKRVVQCRKIMQK